VLGLARIGLAAASDRPPVRAATEYFTLFTMVARRTPLTRAAVVQAARDLIAADGLEGLSVRRVAAALGVSAPALYAYVENKPDLLRAVAELEFEGLVERFDAVQCADPVDRIRGHIRAYVEHARADPALFEVMFLFRPDWAAQPAVEELPAASKVFTIASAAIEEAMLTDALRAEDPFLVAIALWAAAHGTASVLLAGLNLGTEFEDRVIDTVIDNLVRGLAAPSD
jgi:AcrR family transcriptional regulator